MAVDVGELVRSDGAHGLALYESEAELIDTVSRYVVEALHVGDAAVLVATPDHREAFSGAIARSGVDVTAATRSGRLVILDAVETLARFTADGKVDRECFRDVIGGVVREAMSEGVTVRAYGEMVAVLWDEGDILGAIELESFWNGLACELSFTLLCGYPAQSVAAPDRADAAEQLRRAHSHVVAGTRPRRRVGAAEVVQAHFTPELSSLAAVRRFLANALAGWGDGDAVADAQLVVNELATNAIQHAASAFSVSVKVTGSEVQIRVWDASSSAPTPTVVGPTAIRGRGLILVTALATRWGVDPVPDGKVVWAELVA